MRIELHIDRLILDGVAEPHQAAAIREALHTELTRLMAASTSATWRGCRSVRRLSTPDVPAPASPTALGAGIAQSVHQGVTGRNGVVR
ncbi:hypothetical protein [Amycolatopsis sp. cmx-4-68]|uniref:hypothetical protein n=1 Tax=Amycolatopsis sp. cmx-4-68 TaxID=2790938 RepID=UPI00397C72BE